MSYSIDTVMPGPVRDLRPGPVRDLRVEDVTETSFTVSWTVPQVTGEGFRVTLEHSDPNTGGVRTIAIPDFLNAPGLAATFTVRGVVPGTPYTVRVITNNAATDGATFEDLVSEVQLTTPILATGKN